jgi:hypothetical protein
VIRDEYLCWMTDQSSRGVARFVAAPNSASVEGGISGGEHPGIRLLPMYATIEVRR